MNHLSEMSHGKTRRQCALVFLILGLDLLVESRKHELERKNSSTNRHILVEGSKRSETRHNNTFSNNNKFRNKNTSNELKKISKMKKRSIESDEVDPRIFSLDYDLIDEVWPQEFIEKFKKNKQGMSGCQFSFLSVFCYLTCLLPVIL